MTVELSQLCWQDEVVQVDELAAKAGTSTRNVRYYQTEGLLPAPRQVGRCAEYDESHRVRLEAIVRLANRGYGLQAIREVLDSHARGGTIGDLIGLDAQLDSAQVNPRCTRAEARQLYGLSSRSLKAAVAAGLLREDGEDQFEVIGEARIAVCQELQGLGIPFTRALPLMADLQAALEPVAHKAVRVVAKEVWQPYVGRGLRSAETSAVSAALGKLREISNRAVSIAWATSLESALASSTRQAAQRRRESSR